MITLLDYGAGNVRSVRNAIRKLGYEVKDVTCPEDIEQAVKLIFPGVGSFGSAMQRLQDMGYLEPLKQYIRAGRSFLGICLGLQTLFEGSEESPGVQGLGVIKGMVQRFDDRSLAVPQIGWNGIVIKKKSRLFEGYQGEKLYFVHSYRAVANAENRDWVLTATHYGGEFVSGIQKGNVAAFQFHPEKSGAAGLGILKNFLAAGNLNADGGEPLSSIDTRETILAKRIIACLDVRTNDRAPSSSRTAARTRRSWRSTRRSRPSSGRTNERRG